MAGMKLIVGLGNPGEKYQKTRHNLGFWVVDELASSVQRLGSSWKLEKKFKAEILELNYPLDASSYTLILAKPMTYVNNSGMAVASLFNFYKVPPGDIWIIHDDLDLPLGKIKIRQGGAAGGHHGVESIIANLGTDQFVRFRLGIKPLSEWEKQQKVDRVEKFVLEPFLPQEKDEVKKMLKKAVKAVMLAANDGLGKAMNRFNAQ